MVAEILLAWTEGRPYFECNTSSSTRKSSGWQRILFLRMVWEQTGGLRSYSSNSVLVRHVLAPRVDRFVTPIFTPNKCCNAPLIGRTPNTFRTWDISVAKNLNFGSVPKHIRLKLTGEPLLASVRPLIHCANQSRAVFYALFVYFPMVCCRFTSVNAPRSFLSIILLRHLPTESARFMKSTKP